MRKIDWKKAVLPHLVSLLLFWLLAFAFFSPMISGKHLNQSDITLYHGMAKELRDVRADTGEQKLWTNRPFSGMPSFLVSTVYKTNLTSWADKALSLFIDGRLKPVKILFLLLAGFYFLAITLGANRWVAIIGAMAYALCSFFILSLEAGHNTKIWTTAYLPAVLASVLWAYRKSAIWGAILLALTLSIQLHLNHPQITYYTFIAGLVLFISEAIRMNKAGRISSFLKTTGLLVVASIFALSTNAGRMMTYINHSPETIRGGKSELTDKQNGSSGLDKDYAFAWSAGIAESGTLLIPNFAGGSSTGSLSKESRTYKTMVSKGVQKRQAEQTIKQLPLYYGPQPFTGGPTYVGVITIFLALLGFLLAKNRDRVWLGIVTLLAMMLSWGKHFFLAGLFFDIFPLFNRFRAPSMILTLAALSLCAMAVIGLHKALFIDRSKEEREQLLKYAFIAVGIPALICVIGILMGGLFWDFKSAADAQLPEWLRSDIIADRKSLLRSDAIRSLIFLIAAFGALFAFIKGFLKKEIVLAAIALLVLADMWMVNKRYLTSDDFISQREYDKQFKKTAADAQLLQDKSEFRVLNTQRRFDQDGHTSYYHNSLGGYSGAKLVRYQDLIERHLSQNNISVLNMLNTKYILSQDGKVQPNGNAMGNAWFVDNIRWVDNADQEINALNDFQPFKEAIMDKRYKDLIGNVGSGSNGTIRLTQNDMDELTYSYNSPNEALAVFSEIFYGAGGGWRAYVDGKEIPVARANYVLRAAKLPAGQHTLKMEFKPSFYQTGKIISLIASLLLFALIGLVKWRYFMQQNDMDLIEDSELQTL